MIYLLVACMLMFVLFLEKKYFLAKIGYGEINNPDLPPILMPSETSEIEELNNYFNGEFKFGEEIKNPLSCNFVFIDGYGGYDLVSPDWQTTFDFSGFYDVMDTYVLTKFESVNRKYKIFGFNVGSKLEEVNEILYNKDYKFYERNMETNTYKKGVITLKIGIENGLVKRIFVTIGKDELAM